MEKQAVLKCLGIRIFENNILTLIETTVIISVYKNVKALGLILQSIARQSVLVNVEVIIAEDNNGEEMRLAVASWQQEFSFPIIHVCQPDEGFRKCKILNEAINNSLGDYLIFMDGDCVLHKHFIKEHLRTQKIGHVVYGRRVMLSERFTNLLLENTVLKPIHFLHLLWYKCARLDAAFYNPFSTPKNKIGFWGHNWSIYLFDMQGVGGFDESYTEAGIGEDTDIEWRLQMQGVQFLRIKNRALQYHLWHKANYPNTKAVEEKLAQKRKAFLEGNSAVLIGPLINPEI